ncbi:hypothetical protein FOT85_23775 [Klebsiella michiganensis]|nr:hypothetical protein [Klebsiella michiganensis]MBZ6644694.1 hypothetical protein [Klebsiella michiganensis]HCK0912852.1 hypothetical protein [Klebsiella michiganensis]
MIHMSNLFRLLCLSLSMIVVSATAAPSYAPVAESILHNGFPTQPDVLAKTTQSLSDEFNETGNIASLVFYAYGMLRQANYFLGTNDFIKASEYAKTGFFYLDEAVDLNQNKPLVRYLRAKVDAYLPAELGRCVITLEDSDILLKQKLSSRIRDNVNDMRYRAFYNCKLYKQAGQLLSILQVHNPNKKIDMSYNGSSIWELDEVTQIITPLVRVN